ncbi:hypothetical protein HanPI659440_Chr03g0132561 [Helianthus annuus]|nr:hypothetical protein HanPI659440_Chr03g0132561 [Helianthus annuus]
MWLSISILPTTLFRSNSMASMMCKRRNGVVEYGCQIPGKNKANERV